jgi:hypothetical protein
MEGTRPAKAAVEKALKIIAERLRDEGESVIHEGLPERWVELILYLDEKERRTNGVSPTAPRKDGER